MNTEQLVVECKKGLSMSVEPDEMIDAAIQQKLLAVRAYLLGAGVSAVQLDSELGIAVMVVGVSDLWLLESGKIQFSPIFNTLMTQLAMRGGE